MRVFLKTFGFFLLFKTLLIAASVGLGNHSLGADWRTASREQVGLAPDPAKTPEAVVQVYGARAFNWRGIFGVHTWISIKENSAPRFETFEVFGWRARYGGQAISRSLRDPDERWYGAEPELYLDIRGRDAERAIPKILQAIEAYPYQNRYVLWPGPNSNTFVAHVARQVPELKLDLPPTAIGKDYLPNALVGATPSNTGYQLSLFGLFGIMGGLEEGLEVNILGLSYGLDPLDLAIKLPMVGRLSPLPD